MAARRQVVGPVPRASGRGPSLPVEVVATGSDIDLVAYVEHDPRFAQHLETAGAVLFRGFRVGGVVGFEHALQAMAGDLVVEHERSSPRTQVAGNVYTSTDHPPDQEIFVHNEMSYSDSWPMRLGFLCVRAPFRGGETPLCDTRRVLERVPAEIVRAFEQRGVMYVRNFSDHFGLPWQLSFGTEDPDAVTAYCDAHGITAEWQAGRLRTTRIGPAIVRHPISGEDVWFNHLVFFHLSTLGQGIREALVADLGEDALPTDARYGDGSPIEPAVLDTLRTAYRSATVSFTWEAGDVLVIDNMLVAHGRRPFEGPREVLVTMAAPASGRTAT
jgi:hypothetical protein